MSIKKTLLIGRFHSVTEGYGEYILQNHSLAKPQYIEIFKQHLSHLNQFRWDNQTSWTPNIDLLREKHSHTQPLFIPRTLLDLSAIKLGILDQVTPYDPSKPPSQLNPINLQEEYAHIQFEVNKFILSHLKIKDSSRSPCIYQYQVAAESLVKDFINTTQSDPNPCSMNQVVNHLEEELTRIVTNAVLVECSVPATHQILYRGIDGNREDSLRFGSHPQLSKRRSLSYGSSLFSAAKQEHMINGAAPWVYGLNQKYNKMQAIVLSRTPLEQSSFFIPGTHPLLYFQQYGEWFHPRTKILKEDLESFIPGLKTPNREQELNYRKQFLLFHGSEQDLETAWKQDTKNAFNLRGQLCDASKNWLLAISSQIASLAVQASKIYF